MMINNFTPDYRNLENAARNIEAKRTPLYEHSIAHGIIEKLTGKSLQIAGETPSELDNFFVNYNGFFKDFGYDTVTFELCITTVLPGGGALGGQVDPVIKTREDFERYPFGDIPRI